MANFLQKWPYRKNDKHFLTMAIFPGITIILNMILILIMVMFFVKVWMITIIGTTFGIPDTVMGLTFIAAGVKDFSYDRSTHCKISYKMNHLCYHLL